MSGEKFFPTDWPQETPEVVLMQKEFLVELHMRYSCKFNFMTPVVPIGEQRAFFSEDCDNASKEPALKNQTSSGTNNQNTEILKSLLCV